MLVRPKAWLNYNSGTYLTAKGVCMRVRENPEQLQELRKANHKGQLDRVLAALDALGMTEWKINQKVCPRKS